MKSKEQARVDMSDMDDRYFALMLSTFRKVRDIVALRNSQGAIASKIGMDEGQLSRLLKGHSNVTLRTLNRIARAADARLEIDVRPLEAVVPAACPPLGVSMINHHAGVQQEYGIKLTLSSGQHVFADSVVPSASKEFDYVGC